MTPGPTTPDPEPSPITEHARRVPRRPAWLLVVVAGFALQIAIASIALAGERPVRYGWQMYSAVPHNPPAWFILDGEERELAVDGLLVHSRAEIDRLTLLRERGCELVEADAIRFELSDGRSETVLCG